MSIYPPAKYINPFTDYGFKRIFGEEPNKDLLKDFLNELLREEEGEIVELQYLNSEQLGRSQDDRKSLFDIYCTNEKGDRFIVELQKTKHLDFSFDEDEDEDKYLYNVKLTEQETKKVFYDKLTFIYLSMPKFTKPLEELETHFDKWLYVFKNLHRLQEIPAKLQEEIFLKLFDTAEVAHLTRDEYMSYEASLKEYWDLTSSLSTSHDEGKEEGIEIGIGIGREEGKKEEKIEIAKNLKSMGLDIESIMQATGLDKSEVESL